MLFRVASLEQALVTSGSVTTRFRFPEAGKVVAFSLTSTDGLPASRAGLGVQIYRVSDRENWSTDGEAQAAFDIAGAEIGPDPNAGTWARVGVDVEQDEEWQITIENFGAPTVTPVLVLDFFSLNEATP